MTVYVAIRIESQQDFRKTILDIYTTYEAAMERCEDDAKSRNQTFGITHAVTPYELQENTPPGNISPEANAATAEFTFGG